MAMRLLACGLLLCSTLAAAQRSDCASVAKSGDEVTLTANSWDPVLAVGRTLADRYGIGVNVEAPKWAFPGDTEDVAVADPEYSAQHGNIHYQVMKRHVVQVRFLAAGNAPPSDVPGLLRQLIEAANKEMPYAYRLDATDSDYALVPSRTRNSAGQLEDVQPLLDRHVSIPSASRPIADHAKLMADQLSHQTGLNISCCQAMVAGIPWGLAKVPFQADDKPAREVLKTLIRLEEQANSEAPNRHPTYDHWSVGCDGAGAPWCFIEVEGKFRPRCQ
ncbi:MAG TPA: hypothetical protein VF840_07215 [Terriglobales bacterium]